MLTFSLLVIGGLNWLLVGLIGWDVGELLGGQSATVSKTIYILVGLSALVEMFGHKKFCKYCSEKRNPKIIPL